MLLKNFLLSMIPIFLFSCVSGSNESDDSQALDQIARDYVKLGLTIGQYDGDFVDAYYGPDSLKPVTKADSVFPKESFIQQVGNLKKKLGELSSTSQNDSIKHRADW